MKTSNILRIKALLNTMGSNSEDIDLTGIATEEFVKNKIAEAQLEGEEVDLSGYAQKSELPTNVSQLQNDVGYLTEHQDISGKLDANKLPEAINTALAQAKASGEFNGADGEDGQDGYTPKKGVDYFDGKDGNDGQDGVSPVVSVSAITGGHRITITDKNGTKTVDVMDGVNGQNGAKGNGIKSAVLNADYTLTLTFDDGTSYTTPSIRGVAGKDGTNGTDGKDGTSATHSWNGTTLTITSASGTSSANLKGEPGTNGIDGVSPTVSVSKSGKVTTVSVTDKNGTKTATINDGADGSNGSNGKDGTSVTVKSVSESTTDGGSNVVTFSDGKTLTVKNGKAGTNGKDGKTPEKYVDYFTASDQEAIVQQVIVALGTPVFGRVDENNNIILTGKLADGTYTLKYEDADGNVTEIGTVDVGEQIPTSGVVDIEWRDKVKLDKTTGAEATNQQNYAASQMIEKLDGRTYTLSRTASQYDCAVSLCCYDASGTYLGYTETIASGKTDVSNALVFKDGTEQFKLRLYYTQVMSTATATLTLEYNAE